MRRAPWGGRDSIDHPVGGRDDVANVVVGVMALLAQAVSGIFRWYQTEYERLRAAGAVR